MIGVLIVTAIVALLWLKKKDEPSAEAIAQEIAEMKNKVLLKKGNGDFKNIPFVESPNKASRGSAKVTTLVWHYTAGAGAAGAISWLCNPESKASAHFVIGRDGAITQLVRLADAAWHVGASTVSNVNAIGVEVVNPGRVTKDKDNWIMSNGSIWKPDGVEPKQATLRFPNGTSEKGYWVPYTNAQVLAMKQIYALIATSPYGDCVNNQCGHEDIATPQGRKIDPGPLFPWDELSTYDQRKRLHKTEQRGVV